MKCNNISEIFSNLNKPLLLDGAVGSLLQQLGYKSDKYLWTSYLNFKLPNKVKEIHQEYIQSGADIITANTFRTNPVSLKKSNPEFSQEKAIEISLNIAKDTRQDHDILIAGSNPPAEDSYQLKRTITEKDLKENHELHIDLLYKYGADLILNETQSHFDEIKIICQHCSKNNIPFIISILVTEDLKILSGENLIEVINFVEHYNPLLISLNCISPKVFRNFINSKFIINNWGFYLNCGSGDYNDSDITCGVSPKEYLEIVKSSLSLQPKLIGACCGSTPAHIKILREYIDGKIST